MKKLIAFIVLSVVAITAVFTMVPDQVEKSIKEGAPRILKIYGYTIVKSNGFNKWKDDIEYVVERKGATDTVLVRLYRGQLSVQPK